MRDYVFRDLHSLLPSEALLVMNQSRVITARLLMNKEGTGGKAEVSHSTMIILYAASIPHCSMSHPPLSWTRCYVCPQ